MMGIDFFLVFVIFFNEMILLNFGLLVIILIVFVVFIEDLLFIVKIKFVLEDVNVLILVFIFDIVGLGLILLNIL